MAQTLPTNPPSKLDGEHYWDFVTFSVEGCLFRLPKYRFVEESEHFCKEYDLDYGSLTPTEEPGYANIDANPDSLPSPNFRDQRDPVIKLEGVNLVDFRCFLKILYPRNGEQELATFTPEQWGSVLKLSTKWFFNDIRHRAIKEIDTVDDMCSVNRIIAAKEHGISQWLLAGYTALVTRDETIDLREGEKIGLRNALQLYQLRDKYHRQGWDKETLQAETKWKFAAEIDEMQRAEREYLTKAERKALKEATAKVKADEELKAVARAREKAQSLAEKEDARREAVEQCEKGLELKRQELAQMEKEREELLASRISESEIPVKSYGGKKKKKMSASKSLSVLATNSGNLVTAEAAPPPPPIRLDPVQVTSGL